MAALRVAVPGKPIEYVDLGPFYASEVADEADVRPLRKTES